MAENKKSFVAYCDWGEIFDELSNEESGKLVKHLFDYVRDKNPTPIDKITGLMFIQIKQSLKRDLVKYDNYIDKQRVNGAKGGRPPKPKKPKPLFENPTEPKKADSVSVSVSVTDNDNVSESKNAHEYLVNNCQIKLDAISMKYFSKIPDWNEMVDIFNLKAEKEELEYKPRILLSRFELLCKNWIKFNTKNNGQNGTKQNRRERFIDTYKG